MRDSSRVTTLIIVIRMGFELQADGVAAADEGEDAKCEESCLHGKIEDFKLVL